MALSRCMLNSLTTMDFVGVNLPIARVVQLTSPNLNYFIIGGSVLMFTSVYIGVLPTTEQSVVHVQCIVS